MGRNRYQTYRTTKLTDRTEIRVRFSEVDAIGIVWHGNFVKYLEDGRESFGRKYRLGYNDYLEHRMLAPIVHMEMDFRHQVRYGEEIIIETSYVSSDAAKIIFHYRILRKSDHAVVLTATTTQVFLNDSGELELTNPGFYLEWKRKHGLTSPGG
jgi:acyl-CoA thioester hydrolase